MRCILSHTALLLVSTLVYYLKATVLIADLQRPYFPRKQLKIVTGIPERSGVIFICLHRNAALVTEAGGARYNGKYVYERLER